jgi:hypothetical protein
VHPAGTYLQNDVMHTPLSLLNDTFVGTISLPPWGDYPLRLSDDLAGDGVVDDLGR